MSTITKIPLCVIMFRSADFMVNCSAVKLFKNVKKHKNRKPSTMPKREIREYI